MSIQENITEQFERGEDFGYRKFSPSEIQIGDFFSLLHSSNINKRFELQYQGSQINRDSRQRDTFYIQIKHHQ